MLWHPKKKNLHTLNSLAGTLDMNDVNVMFETKAASYENILQ